MSVKTRQYLKNILKGAFALGIGAAVVAGALSGANTNAMAADAVFDADYEAAVENGVKVFVDAPEGALPEDAKLHAELVESEKDNQAVADELEKADVAYDGFLALDVFFTDVDGNEVEPAEPVDVRFELPEGTLPEGAEDLAVHHLAEAEDGTVSEVEAVADDADATEGTVAVQDDATVDAEFTVESFSWFTLTYKTDDDIQVNLVTEDGSGLPGEEVNFDDLSGTYRPTDFDDKYITDQWVSIEKLAETWASKTEGYEFVGAYMNQQRTNKFNWIRYNVNNSADWWEESNQGWRYSTANSAPRNANGSGSLSEIYLVYREISDPDQTAVTIADNVSASGKLTASYDNANDVFYVWEKSSNGTDGWQTIEQLKLNGDQYLYDDADQRALNVALEVVNDTQDDGGSWYRVSAYASQDAYESGEDALATSAATQLDYYDELQNGDFELPDVEELTAGDKSNYQYPVGTEDLVWKTTGSDQQVEIVNENGNTHNSDYNNSQGAQSGKQYAELNCQAAGALYQDVLTVPGTDLNWQLYHRGRYGNDTMYLVIAPTDKVDEITTQADLNDLIQKIEQNQSSYQESDGYYLLEIGDGNTSWNRYASGSNGRPAYEVPDGQYMTRFFFVAGDTTSSGNTVDNTVGNLLDNVQFTTGLLPAEDGEANLTITKVVSGVSEAAMKGYSVKVDVDGQTVTLDSFNPQQGGTYSATMTVTVHNIPGNGNKTVTVTESANTPGGYTAAGSTVSVNDGQAQDGTSAQVALQERGSGSVKFTNTYTPPTPPTPEDVTVGNGKSAVLDEESGNYTLNLSVNGNGSTDTSKRKLDILFILDESASMDYMLTEDEKPGSHDDEPTRKELLQDAVNGLVDSVSNNSAGIDARFAAVSFSASQNSDTTNGWTNAQGVKSFVSSLNPEEGTNYQQGIYDAKQLLKSSDRDAQTYVIFVSDGEPTYRGINVTNAGSWSDHGTGTGSDDDEGLNIQAAVNEIQDMTCDVFYAIGMGPHFGQGKRGTENLESLANAVNATSKGDGNVFNVSDTSSLESAFASITADMTSLAVKDVTMIDVLSQWADLVPGTDGQYTFSFQLAKAGDGGFANEGNPTNFTLSKGGSATKQIKVGDETIEVKISLSESAKTITVDFPDDYQLDPAYRYTVSTTIAPSQAAIGEGMGSNNATQTPDHNTGTHADNNEQGFWSNDNEQSLVTYRPVRTDNGVEVVGDKADKPFPKPVIQVNTAEVSGALQVVKNLEGDELVVDEFDITVTAVKADAVNTNRESRSQEAADLAWGKNAETQLTRGNGTESEAPVELFHTGSDLTLDAGDIDQKYAYIYEEVTGSDSNYTYDKTAWKVVVFVERSEDGDLVPYAQVYKDADGKNDQGNYEWIPCDENLSETSGEAAKIKLEEKSEGTPAITIQFNNKVSKADLSITKTVNKPAEGVVVPSGVEFSIQVELKDEQGAPISGTFEAAIGDRDQAVVFDGNGRATVELKADQTIIIKDVPVGATCKVTEPEEMIPGGFQLQWIGEANYSEEQLSTREAIKKVYKEEIQTDGNDVVVCNGFIGYGLSIFKGELAYDENGEIALDDGLPYADPEHPLSGAVFEISIDIEDKKTVLGSLTTDQDGTAEFMTIPNEDGQSSPVSLMPGTYHISEVKVPSGYQLLGYEITLTIDESGAATISIPQDESEPITKKLQFGEDGNYRIEVANKPNPDLPSSGSNGTLLMMSTGFAAIVLAGTYLSKRFGHLWN